MNNGEAARRHSEALRLFEAGLRALYEGTGASVAPTRVQRPEEDRQPERLFDPRPPSRAFERGSDLADAP
jgi:hypothetical protein